ncbi:MAG TPA: MFS transporter [Bryobacteraceae bacterium]|nr:MFS transporter [Bryobacteraceae bacterium]
MKVSGLRWYIAGLLFIETILAYLDLQVLSVLAPVLSRELHLTNAQYAGVTQAFLIAYSITFLLGGRVIDRLGVRRGLALSLVWWSTANMAHALATSAEWLAVFRFLMGLGYPGAFLAAAKAVSEWYPPEERAFVYGIYVSGATLGAVIAYPLVVSISLRLGWQAAFVVTGGAGLVFVIVWLLLYHSPDRHPWITPAELAHVSRGKVAGEAAPSLMRAWKTVVKERRFWTVAIGRLLADSPWMFYVLWLPKFLTAEQGLSMQTIGRFGWIPFIFADIGSIGGGWLSGGLIRRGVPNLEARLRVLTVAACVVSLAFLLAFPYPTPVLFALLCLFMMCQTAWTVNLNVITVDTFPSRLVATASGLTTCFGTTGSVFFTAAVGWIVQRYTYDPVFFLMSALSAGAYLAVRLILKGAPQPALEAREGSTP